VTAEAPPTALEAFLASANTAGHVDEPAIAADGRTVAEDDAASDDEPPAAAAISIRCEIATPTTLAPEK
jgi:hypothetical protein